jgi:lysozyme
VDATKKWALFALLAIAGGYVALMQFRSTNTSEGGALAGLADALDFSRLGFGADATKLLQDLSAQDAQGANMRAFLDTISTSEGTDKGADTYAVCYGYKHTISSFADHPAITGEWKGEKLPDHLCTKAGISPPCVSSAAGRYQIKKSTWQRAKNALGLQNFDQHSQDAAALWLIDQRGGLEYVKAGQLAKALQACAKEWASLPGAGYGQGERTATKLAAVYEQAGGTITA